MRILYIGSFRLPFFDAASQRVLNISRALRESGHKIYFISWGGEQRAEDLCEDGVWRVDGFPYLVTNELSSPGQTRIGRLWGKLQRGRKTKRLITEWDTPIDVIITYNNCLCRWLIPFCQERGIKLINDITEWYAYNELNPLEWISYTYDMHCIQKQVKNKIVISSYLDRFYSTTHNIVVPATCDASELKWKTGKEKAIAVVGDFDGITLIYAGNPARKDAVHHVINAVQRLIDEGAKLRFIILGVELGQYISNYGYLLTNKDLNKHIQFLGRVPQDDVPSFYSLADFMVLLREPSRKSNAGFPTKFTESFTSGTPVIANLTSDIGVYLKDGKTGFVVSEPTEDEVYRVLKEKVLSLNIEDLFEIKHNVGVMAEKLDYHTYIGKLGRFIETLK